MDPRIQKTVLLIEGQSRSVITTRQMAGFANLSVAYFCRLFKDATGQSPARYLKDLRMRAACALLQTSDLTVKELSMRVGFKDQSHFVRDFEKTYGLSPRRYRHRWHERDRHQETTSEHENIPIGQ